MLKMYKNAFIFVCTKMLGKILDQNVGKGLMNRYLS